MDNAMADAAAVRADHPTADDAIFRRLNLALASVPAVLAGAACLTPQGTAYFGIRSRERRRRRPLPPITDL